MLTATKRAEWMALQIFIAATQHNGRVVTHDLVDAVMSRDADKEQGKANKETVRRIIRKQAASERVRVIFTDDERYWAIREQLHHMSTDDVQALCDEIVNGGDADPRGWDRQLTDAISARLSKRLSPRRLDTAEPVSIRLWTAPDPRPATAPLSAEETARDERMHVRIVNDGPSTPIPTREALDEINAAMMQPLVRRTVKRMSASRSTAHIVYRDGRTVYLRPATPGDTFPTPTERPTDAELTGPLDSDTADYYAETFAAIADGTAIPVRADMAQPGMDVIAAHLGETRTIGTFAHYVGPGAPWVRISWTTRNHNDSVMGDRLTYPPEMHLMVTCESLDRVFGPAPVAIPPHEPAPVAPMGERVPVSELHIGDAFVTRCAWTVRAIDGGTFTAVSNEGQKVTQTVPEDTIVLRTRRAIRTAAAREARAYNVRLEAQQLATNQVIEERARESLASVLHPEAGEGKAGFVFRTNHLAVCLRGVNSDGEDWPLLTEALRLHLEHYGWFVEPAKCHGVRITPSGDVAEIVREGQRRSVDTAHAQALAELAQA